MALVISLRQGDDLYVGDRRLVVNHIHSPYRFNVRREDGHVFTLNTEDWDEVFQDVFVQAGIPRKSPNIRNVALVIDAPGEVVLRGGLYRREVEGNCETCKGTRKLSHTSTCSKCNGAGCSSCVKGQVVIHFVCPDCPSKRSDS